MKNSVYIISLFLTSCSILHKNETSIIKERNDLNYNSSIQDIKREVITTEQALVPVLINADSIVLKRWISMDSINFTQIVEKDGIRLETTISPEINKGIITGLNLNSKAIRDQQQIMAPINKTVISKETSTVNIESTKVLSNKDNFEESEKESRGFNIVNVLTTLGSILFLLIIIIFYKKIKNAKKFLS